MELVARAAFVYFFLWFITRIIGKKELASLTGFELILLIVMGDLVQQGVTQEDYSLTGDVLVIGTMTLLMVFFSWLSFRFKRARPALEGLPIVVVQDGRIREDAANSERLDKDELFQALRQQGIDTLEKVRLGIIEPDGKFSFFTHEDHPQGAPEKEHR